MSVTQVLETASTTSLGAGQTFTGGAGTFANLHEPDDDNTSYLGMDNTGPDQSVFGLDDLPASAAQILSVTSKLRSVNAGGGASGQIRVGLKYGGNYVLGTTRTPVGDPTYTTYTQVHATGPLAVVWTPAILNATEITNEKVNSGVGTTMRTTTLNLTVVYEPHAGGHRFLIQSWLIGLLGTGVSVGQIWGLGGLAHALAIRSQGRVALDRRGWLQAVKELRGAIPRRVFV